MGEQKIFFFKLKQKRRNKTLTVVLLFAATLKMMVMLMLILQVVRVDRVSTVHLLLGEHFVQVFDRGERESLLTEHHILFSDDHRFDEKLRAVLQIFDFSALYLF